MIVSAERDPAHMSHIGETEIIALDDDDEPSAQSSACKRDTDDISSTNPLVIVPTAKTTSVKKQESRMDQESAHNTTIADIILLDDDEEKEAQNHHSLIPDSNALPTDRLLVTKPEREKQSDVLEHRNQRELIEKRSRLDIGNGNEPSEIGGYLEQNNEHPAEDTNDALNEANHEATNALDSAHSNEELDINALSEPIASSNGTVVKQENVSLQNEGRCNIAPDIIILDDDEDEEIDDAPPNHQSRTALNHSTNSNVFEPETSRQRNASGNGPSENAQFLELLQESPTMIHKVPASSSKSNRISPRNPNGVMCYNCGHSFPSMRGKEDHECPETADSESSREAADPTVETSTSTDSAHSNNRSSHTSPLLMAKQNGWSQDRQRVWNNRCVNVSKFYYRFSASGIVKNDKEQMKLLHENKSGDWSAGDHKEFMKRAMEIGVTKWGTFSKTIPGRVGYMCYSYWKKLLQRGDVTDRCYYRNANGDLRYKWGRFSGVAGDDTLDRMKRFSFVVHRDLSGTFQPDQKHPKHVSDYDSLEKQHQARWMPKYMEFMSPKEDKRKGRTKKRRPARLSKETAIENQQRNGGSDSAESEYETEDPQRFELEITIHSNHSGKRNSVSELVVARPHKRRRKNEHNIQSTCTVRTIQRS